MKKLIVIPLILSMSVPYVCYADNREDIDVFAELEESLGEEKENLVTFHKDIYCVVDGSVVNITGCVMKNDRVYVPIKPIFEAMGFTVTYSAKIQQVGLVRGNSKILLDLGRGIIVGTLSADNKSVELNAVLDDSVELNGAIYIPIRNLTENMYCEVEWNQGNSTVYIKSPSLKDVVTEIEPVNNIDDYIDTNATEYYKNLISVVQLANTSNDFEKKMEGIDQILEFESNTGIEIETARVCTNFKTKMYALSALKEKPSYNTSQTWDSLSYTGYDTYRASTAELKCLAERLVHEGILSPLGADEITTLASDVEDLALGQ